MSLPKSKEVDQRCYRRVFHKDLYVEIHPAVGKGISVRQGLSVIPLDFSAGGVGFISDLSCYDVGDKLKVTVLFQAVNIECVNAVVRHKSLCDDDETKCRYGVAFSIKPDHQKQAIIKGTLRRIEHLIANQK